VKVTTEKLPKSLLALDIELDQAQVEKGLDRAARRLSQKYTIPGFRKGKAPRFIIENYFGRPALIEEAYEDLVNNAFKQALDQEQIVPVGKANLEETHFEEAPFRFRVTVPVEPTSTRSVSASWVTGSNSGGGTTTRPSEVRPPTTRPSRSPVRKAPRTGPVERV